MKKFLSVILAVLILVSTFSFSIVSAATNVKVTVKSSQNLFNAVSHTYQTGDVFELRIRWRSEQLLRDADFSTIFDNTGLKVISEEVNPKIDDNAVTNISDDIQNNHSKVTANFSVYNGVEYFSTGYLVKYKIQVLDTASNNETINIDFVEASGIPATGNLAEEVIYVFKNEVLSANSSSFTLSTALSDAISSEQVTTTPTTAPTIAPTTAPTSATTAPTTSTSQTNKYFFLSGSFNDWASLIMSLSVSGDTATASVLIGKGNFTFHIIDSGVTYGYNGEIADSTTETGITMRSGSEDATLIATGGLYYFAYNITTRKLVVTRYTDGETEPTETTPTTPTTEPAETETTDYYLTGSFNNWSMTNTPLTVKDSVATADVVLSEGSYEFKIVDSGTLYGYSGSAISNKTSASGITMKSSGSYATLTASGGTYTFNYYPATRKLIISHSTGSEGGYKPGTTDPTEKPTDTDISVTNPTEDDNNKECQFGHSYSNGVVTKKATYFAKGRKVQTCSVCKATRTVKTPKLTLAKPKVTVSGGKKMITVNYKKVKGATGFQIRYKTKNSTVLKSFNSKKSVVKQIKPLNKGSYKVQVRAFVKKNSKKVYSGWTKMKTVKVK